MSPSSRKFFNELRLRSNDTQKVIDKRSTLWYSPTCLFTLTLEVTIKISIAHPPRLAPHSPLFSPFPFIRLRTLSFSVSRKFCVCHSYENSRVCTNNSHSGTEELGWPVGSLPLHQSLATSYLPPIVVSFYPVNILLTDVECRVLGSLVEKEITTPEYYPLSLNGLVNACNQKSNREPATNLDEAAVRQALHSLSEQSLVRSVSAADSRVTKYEHRLQEAFNFYRHEIAILCVL